MCQSKFLCTRLVLADLEESDEFDVNSGRNEDVDVFIIIPLEVDQDTYDVVIEVEGDDANGNTHSIEMNLRLKVDKEARDVVISSASLFPETVKCSGISTLTATIKNIGSRIEDDTKIEILNSDLDINVVEKSIELEEDPFDDDNEFTKRVSINIDKGTEAGTYPIEVNAYIQEESKWETKTVNLVVEACNGQPAQQEEEETDETETPETGSEGEEEELTETTKIPVLEPTTTTEVPLTKRPGFWVGVVILNILVIGGISTLIIKFAGKK